MKAIEESTSEAFCVRKTPTTESRIEPPHLRQTKERGGQRGRGAVKVGRGGRPPQNPGWSRPTCAKRRSMGMGERGEG